MILVHLIIILESKDLMNRMITLSPLATSLKFIQFSQNLSEKEINNQHKIRTLVKLHESIEKAMGESLNQRIFSTFLPVTPKTFFLLFVPPLSLSVTSYDVWMKAFSHAVMTVY